MIQEYDANKDEEVPPRIWGDWDGGLREQEKQNEKGAHVAHKFCDFFFVRGHTLG